MNRSTLAGKQLAHVLLSREQGKRPVSLIGFRLVLVMELCPLAIDRLTVLYGPHQMGVEVL